MAAARDKDQGQNGKRALMRSSWTTPNLIEKRLKYVTTYVSIKQDRLEVSVIYEVRLIVSALADRNDGRRGIHVLQNFSDIVLLSFDPLRWAGRVNNDCSIALVESLSKVLPDTRLMREREAKSFPHYAVSDLLSHFAIAAFSVDEYQLSWWWRWFNLTSKSTPLYSIFKRLETTNPEKGLLPEWVTSRTGEKVQYGSLRSQISGIRGRLLENICLLLLV
jgi:hypothetical protein